MPELHFAKCRRELDSWPLQSSTLDQQSALQSSTSVKIPTQHTNEWSDEDADVAGKSKETECPCLSVLCAVFREHGSDGDDCSRKDAI